MIGRVSSPALPDLHSALRLAGPARAARRAPKDVERAFNRLRQHRAVATRYDKRDFVYRGTVDVAAIRIWLRDLTQEDPRDTPYGTRPSREGSTMGPKLLGLAPQPLAPIPWTADKA